MSKSTMTQYVKRIAKREGIDVSPVKSYINNRYPAIEIANDLNRRFSGQNRVIRVDDSIEAIHNFKL